MLSYEEVIACLYEAKSSTKGKGGFEAVKGVAKALGYPNKSFVSIHVAGTNGKGSVCTKIAKILELSGFKVGLYTSPHLYSFQERISINGELISEEDVVLGAKEIFHAMDFCNLKLNFFEMTTLIAFCYFKKKKVDIAVVETGLGGRWDPTNIITPVLSVITSIGKDHLPVLGNALEEIAWQKAGIIKQGVPVVLGPSAQSRSIFEEIKKLSSPYKIATSSSMYDLENREIALSSASYLQALYSISEEAIKEGVKVRPSCRFEEIKGVIFDVAHNEDGFKRLLEALESNYPKRSFRMLIGMSKDKEIQSCLEIVTQKASHLYLVQAHGERAATTAELKEMLIKLNYADFSQEKEIAEGVCNALRDCEQTGDILVVAGSFFIMAEAREALEAGATYQATSLL